MILGALAIGLTLGLLGSGGSAVTVPVLIYLVGHETKQAIAESMAIVGVVSLVAAIPYGRQRLIDWTNVLFFGLPGMCGTFIGAWLGGLAPGALQLAVFGTVLIASAYAMFRQQGSAQKIAATDSAPIKPVYLWKIALDGTVVGILTGFVGVGGGFLIVPALVLLGRLPIRMAIGTSLVIIALKSSIGFVTYQFYLLSQNSSVDLQTLLIFIAIGIVGSVGGKLLNQRINQQLLSRLFATFLLILGGWLFISEGSNLLLPGDSPPAPSTDEVN